MNGNVIVLLCFCTCVALCAGLSKEKSSSVSSPQLQSDDLNIRNPLDISSKLTSKPKTPLKTTPKPKTPLKTITPKPNIRRPTTPKQTLPESTESRCSCKGEKYDTKNDFSYYIMRGKPSEPNAHPNMVSLRYAGGIDWNSNLMMDEICGGTIINRCFILTAAHCVHNYKNFPERFGVVVGLHNLLSVRSVNTVTHINVRGIRVRNIHVHNWYNSTTLANDIAILELAEPITYNNDVQYTYLASVARSYANTIGIAVGWGLTAECIKPRLLQEVGIPIISLNLCKDLTAHFVYAVSDNSICTSNPHEGKSIYRGDSGGPLFANGEQVGITSWVQGDHNWQNLAVYIRVSAYIDYIRNHLAGAVDCNIHTRV